MSEKQRQEDRRAFEERILSALTGQNAYLVELGRYLDTGYKHTRKALHRLEHAGRVRRLVCGAWALTLAERNRRTRQTVVSGYIPPPPYETPDVGWWG